MAGSIHNNFKSEPHIRVLLDDLIGVGMFQRGYASFWNSPQSVHTQPIDTKVESTLL